MYYYKAFGLVIFSELELPELCTDKGDGQVDLTITVGKIKLPKVRKTNIQRRGVMAQFGLEGTSCLYLNWPGIAKFEAKSGNLLVVDPTHVSSDVISLFTVSEALGLILYQRGLFLLHASAVKVGKKAYCFMGNPGAGKSTTAAAFMKAGCKLLSDDLTAIGFNKEGVPFVIPAYPQLKIWENTVQGLNYESSQIKPVSEGINKYSYQPISDFDHEPVPLGAVFFLHKARNKKYLEPLIPVEIPVKLLRNFPLPISLVQEEKLKQHFQQSFGIAAHCELFNKRRDKNFEALQVWVQSQL
mgnify:CR=1 FL=1